MGEAEDDAGFVGEAWCAEFFGLPRVGEDEESGEVVFVGLDALFEYFHSVEWCCCF